MIGRILIVGVASAALAAIPNAPSPASSTAFGSAQATDEEPRPSIVFIVTDDQRWDTLSVMPTVRHRIGGAGVKFRNGFVVNPLCCPSRASILTGQYSHSTGLYRNEPPYGGFPSFDDSSTLPVWLSEAGYKTGLFGKYLNQYRETTYVPPGWSRWVVPMASATDQYFDYDLNVDGTMTHRGTAPEDYLTDVLADHAVSWIKKNPTRPLFLYFAPKAPHGPATPAPRHAGAPVPTWDPPPSFNERNVSDKPAHIRALPKVSDRDRIRIRRFRAKQLRTLMAVDDAVDRILDALEQTGRLSTTLVVFTSDNGFTWGEHRWVKNKQVPYEESIRVPFLVRYDPLVSQARRDGRFVLNIDLAPTAAEIAGTTAPDADGESLLPLLASAKGPGRSDFLIEHMGLDEERFVPSYCAVRNNRHTYVAYDTGETELYDLASDPYQLKNRASDPALEGVRTELSARVGTLCDPPPPGMDPPGP